MYLAANEKEMLNSNPSLYGRVPRVQKRAPGQYAKPSRCFGAFHCHVITSNDLKYRRTNVLVFLSNSYAINFIRDCALVDHC